MSHKNTVWETCVFAFFGAQGFMFSREDKGDQILDYNLEIQTMEEQLKKLQKEVQQKAWCDTEICSSVSAERK